MNTIAEKIRLKRKELGLSQQNLAQGLCEQSQISKIERGSMTPSIELLRQLSQRLNVNIGYFFDEEIQVKSDLIHFKKISSRLLHDRNYDDLDYIYQLEKEKHASLSLEDQLYLKWVGAILDFRKYDRKDKAISELETSIAKVPKNHLIYLRMLNTLSNFYLLVKRDVEYETNYSTLMELYDKLDLNNQEILFGLIRIRYNYAYYLNSKERYSEAIQEALKTIDICKNHQTVYQLAPLYILVGNAGSTFLAPEQVKHYYLEARDLCRIYGDTAILMKVEEYLKELEDTAKE